MKEITLTQGKVTFVDNIDYDVLKCYRWFVMKTPYTYYAYRTSKRQTIKMHRTILGLQPGDKRECDHRDGNGLNNIRSNLRVCTHTQNLQYQRKQAGGTSRFKGVSWDSHYGKWRSQICVNNKRICLGRFDSEIDAARVFDAAALKYHNEFALTNKMLGLL